MSVTNDESSYEEVFCSGPTKASFKRSKVVNESTNKSGRWTEVECVEYHEFVKSHPALFYKSRMRQNRVFKLMSMAIPTRSAYQCRSHHTKMLKADKYKELIPSRVLRSRGMKVKYEMIETTSVTQAVESPVDTFELCYFQENLFSAAFRFEWPQLKEIDYWCHSYDAKEDLFKEMESDKGFWYGLQ